ncbi:MAG: hypothetical protein M1826_001649 [Phylliscum demangeonii]|nr:MAG: hypothetical protein M1826_001649 [Phylliscum demangeonii]
MTHAMTSLLVVLALAMLPCSFGVPAHLPPAVGILQKLLSPLLEQDPGEDNVLDRFVTGPSPQTASFDELKVFGPGLHPIPTPYQSLRFNSLSVSPLKRYDDELEPHSAPNRIEHGVLEQLLVDPAATIDVGYPGSKVKSFDLHSFWFGCTTNSAVSGKATALTCTIAVTGTKADGGDKIGPITLDYDPEEVDLADQYAMQEATFTNMTRLSKASVKLVKAKGKGLVQVMREPLMKDVLYLDDVPLPLPQPLPATPTLTPGHAGSGRGRGGVCVCVCVSGHQHEQNHLSQLKKPIQRAAMNTFGAAPWPMELLDQCRPMILLIDPGSRTAVDQPRAACRRGKWRVPCAEHFGVKDRNREASPHSPSLFPPRRPLTSPVMRARGHEFDDLSATGPGLHSVPTPYQSLRFSSLSVSPLKRSGDELAPHTAPNRVEHGALEQLMAEQDAVIDVGYPGSKVKSFDLHSFWFGCTTNSVVSGKATALACSIAVTGTKADGGDRIGPITLDYDPDLVDLADQYAMQEAAFTNMTRLSKASVKLVREKKGEGLVEAMGERLMKDVPYLDDVVHTNYF